MNVIVTMAPIGTFQPSGPPLTFTEPNVFIAVNALTVNDIS